MKKRRNAEWFVEFGPIRIRKESFAFYASITTALAVIGAIAVAALLVVLELDF